MSKEIKKWSDKINWKQRVKAVCKPCWELKYCPYGPLVEEFPIAKERNEKSCRIFGHDCPVFYCNEPLTETRELRNISRKISRKTEFRVLKRDNQICSVCGKSVLDEDIEFDHIIPWSKGGSSDEYNVRILCADCNKSRGNDFEFEFLVNSFTDHMTKQDDEEILGLFIDVMQFAHEFKSENEKYPNPQEIADTFSDGELTVFEERMAEIINDFDTYFNFNETIDIPKIQHKALRKRWGFIDNEIYYLKEVAEEFKVSIKKLVQYEILFIEKQGFPIKRDKKVIEKWEKL